jgi:hypothetical protein
MLRRGEAEHEVHREAAGVALDGLVQSAGGDAIDGCQVGIQNHALASHEGDGAGDVGR